MFLDNPLTGIGGSEIAAVGIGTYPHEIRLSNYDVHFASIYPIYGSKDEVQYINPDNKNFYMFSMGISITKYKFIY